MNQERIFKVLLGPHVSEKATVLADSKNQFVFKVDTTATKLEIKKAVEQLFDVKVKTVATLNVKGKTKRTVRGLGKRNDWKKAYVSLQPGQDISDGQRNGCEVKRRIRFESAGIIVRSPHPTILETCNGSHRILHHGVGKAHFRQTKTNKLLLTQTGHKLFIKTGPNIVHLGGVAKDQG